jgi:hypothetical protein
MWNSGSCSKNCMRTLLVNLAADRAVQSLIDPGDAVIASCDSVDRCALCEFRISAIVPLWFDNRSSVALVLFQLLPERKAFDDEDRIILQLLSSYTGPA